MIRRTLPSVGLFFLSPLVAEYLLGDIPITALYALVGLAPLYGGGALLIREVSRRAGWGWPSMLTLALAYGVLDEGVCTQSLFNPHYAGFNLLAPGHIAALGMSAPWTAFVLTLHVVWSISVPVALAEAATRGRSSTPWLGRLGLAVAASLFGLGVLFVTAQSLAQDGLVASGPQLAGVAVAVVGLVVLAVTIGRRKHADRDAGGRSSGGPRPAGRRPVGWTPPAWVLGLVSLLTTSAFMVGWFEARDNHAPWVFAALVPLGYAAGLALVHRWSAGPGWTRLHPIALAGGALLTYAWHGFQTPLLMPASPAVKLVGNAVFALGAVTLLVALAAAREARVARPRAATAGVQRT